MLLVVSLLCGGLISLLLLNVVLAQDSFKANELSRTNEQLRQKKDALKYENMLREQPNVLARDSAGQGQVPDWEKVRAITPDRPVGSRVASEGQTPTGQERVPGTGR